MSCARTHLFIVGWLDRISILLLFFSSRQFLHQLFIPMSPSSRWCETKPLSANAYPLTLFAAAPNQRERKELPLFCEKRMLTFQQFIRAVLEE